MAGGYVRIGPQTVFNGMQPVATPNSMALMAPSVAPTTVLGPRPQPTIPPSVSGTIGAMQMAGGGSSALGNPYAVAEMSAAQNPTSSHSAVVWAVGGLIVAIVGLHLIFWPKEKVI